MQFAEHDIRQFTETAWDSVLALPVKHDVELMNPAQHDHTVAASVHITGAWEGALVVFCAAALGRRIAAIMFDVETDAITSELIGDSMGEMANIIGGGVKGLFEGECRLSLPTVADGTVYTMRVRGSKVVSEVAFECEGHPFKVSLLERESTDSLG